MGMLTIEGIVENGQIRLRDPLTLPEQTRVLVVVPSVEVASPGRIYSPRLADPSQARDFVKEVREVAADVDL